MKYNLLQDLIGFFGGDEVDIQCLGLWSTDARRTALWADAEEDHRLILCSEFNENFAIHSADTTLVAGGTRTEVALHWNAVETEVSSGGYMRLQRRQGGSNDPWQYFSIGEFDVLNEITVHEDSTIEFYNSQYLTLDQGEAHVWRNRDEDQDGVPDEITFIDPTLLTQAWQCKLAEYRIEQEMCNGNVHYTPVFEISILGEIENPWKIDGELSQGISTSHGDFPFKVRIDWSTATDQNDIIDQFRVYRRPYEPANPNDLAWQQIFSSEDFTWFIDQDIAAGVLYEYKVGAIVNCASSVEQSATDVSIQEFFPPEPHNIGFRSASGGVSGEILFEDGSPSGNARVEVKPQGAVGARNSLELEASEYVKLDLNELTGASSSNWPNIHSHEPGHEWSISQWIQIPTNSWTSLTPEEAQTGIPLVAFNYTNPSTQLVNEAFSIRATTENNQEISLQLVQAGVASPFNVSMEPGMFNHLIVTLTNDISNLNSNQPSLQIQVTCSDDQWEISPETGIVELNIPAEEINEIRRIGILWNAASYAAPSCSDPFSLNFAPLSTSSQQAACNYESAGCSDPQANQLSGQSTAEYDAHTAETDVACDYGNMGTGQLISVRWFSDDSPNPDEAPAIYALNGSEELLVHDFHADLIAVHAAAGVFTPTLCLSCTKLAAGQYRIRVNDHSAMSTGEPAQNFRQLLRSQ